MREIDASKERSKPRRLRPLRGGEDVLTRFLDELPKVLVITAMLAVMVGFNGWKIDLCSGFFISLVALILLSKFLGLTRGLMARSKVAAPKVWIQPFPPRLGDTLSCRLSFKFRDVVPLEAAIIRLYAEESKKGSTDRSEAQITFDESRRQLEGIQASPGVEHAAEAIFTIPADGKNTFVRGDESCRWFLDVRLEISGWPDYEIRYPLNVRPRVGERGEASEKE